MFKIDSQKPETLASQLVFCHLETAHTMLLTLKLCTIMK